MLGFISFYPHNTYSFFLQKRKLNSERLTNGLRSHSKEVVEPRFGSYIIPHRTLEDPFLPQDPWKPEAFYQGRLIVF